MLKGFFPINYVDVLVGGVLVHFVYMIVAHLDQLVQNEFSVVVKALVFKVISNFWVFFEEIA